MDISLEDAFADFLNEVDEVAASDVPPSPKRPRKTSVTESAEDAAEAAARTKRLARAEKLRKASFVGDVSKIDRILGALSIVDRLLLVDSSDPDDGFTALHLAVIRKHIDCVTALLRYRADIDAQSDAGDTPLMWAATQGSIDICKTLLNAGADCKLKNAKGATASTQAQAARHRRVFEMLENYEIDVATGLHRKGAAAMDAAAARRAANMAMVQAAIRAQQEKEEEDAFWNAVKQRREKRGSSVQSDAKTARETDQDIAEGTRKVKDADFLALPEKVRPHYLILEAPPDAEVEEIRKLYRKLALKNHPDKNPLDLVGSKERFTKIAEAYEAVCQYLGSVEKIGVRIAPPKL